MTQLLAPVLRPNSLERTGLFGLSTGASNWVMVGSSQHASCISTVLPFKHEGILKSAVRLVKSVSSCSRASFHNLVGCASRSGSDLPPPPDNPVAKAEAGGPMLLGQGPVVYDSTAAAPPAAPMAAPANTPVAAPPAPADPWPRDIAIDKADALIYQPQVESWTGNALAWRVAVALRPAGQKDETFGVLWGTARTDVDRGTRSVELNDVTISKINFPTLPDKGAQYLAAFRRPLRAGAADDALDSLEASLAASQTVKPQGRRSATSRRA